MLSSRPPPAARRLLSTSRTLSMPLQPLKQRKTFPFRHPRRPRPLDPLSPLVVASDPSTIRLPVSDGHRPAEFFVRRNAVGIPPPSYPLPPSPSPASSSTETTILPPALDASPSTVKLSPEAVAELRLLRRSTSLSTLARKFGITKGVASLLGWSTRAEKREMEGRQAKRVDRHQARESVEARLRREERRVRRSRW